MPTRCWSWTASRSKDGYGQFRLAGKMEKSHRVAFLLRHGRWPEPCALHRCDNPSCVRWSHLFEGTQLDNAADRDAKGRNAQVSGEAHGRSELTLADVEAIRATRGVLLQRELAKIYGVSQAHISKIQTGQQWRSEQW